LTIPAGIDPSLALHLQQVEERLTTLESPMSPRPLYACTAAELPAAASFLNCVVRVTDLNILAASDGASWRRQDTGAAI